MSENEPSFSFEMPNHGEFEATRDNTVMFRHMGRLAMYDHVFFIRDAEKGQGTYLFSHHPSYPQLADWLMDNDFPAHINLRQVAQCDIDAFDSMISKDANLELENGVPDDWT